MGSGIVNTRPDQSLLLSSLPARSQTNRNLEHDWSGLAAIRRYPARHCLKAQGGVLCRAYSYKLQEWNVASNTALQQERFWQVFE